MKKFIENTTNKNIEKEGILMNIFNLLTKKNKEELSVPATTCHTFKDSDINLVEINGVICNKYSPNANVTILTVSTGDGMKYNHPKIVCYNENNRFCHSLSEGDFVSITGNIQSSLKDDELKVSIFCNKITKSEKEVFGTLQSKNKMHLRGKIKSVTKGYNMLELKIKTFTNGHISIFPVVFYTNEKYVNLKPGDYISVYGNIQTVKKIDYFGKTKYYENYVAFQIEKEEKCTELELGA